MKRSIKLAVVGCSGRGNGMMGLIAEMADVEVISVCDLYPDRVKNAQELFVKANRQRPKGYTDYRKMIDDGVKEGLEAVFCPSSWQSHVEICLYAMEAGLYVATEVGGAYSVQACWDLVHTSERTGMPCMLLENCCYGREEMAILNMVKKGLFGELVHAEGGYCHDLRSEIDNGKENRHYRLANFKHRNGELYPTHDLGPIAKYLDINCGNRMLTLTSMASKAVGLRAWARANRPEGDELRDYPFNEGDVVTTMIKCARGETIVLTHDCSLHRPYSRRNMLQGTKGIWMEDKHSVSIEGLTKSRKGYWDPECWQDLNDFWKKYDHPLWKKFQTAGVKGGHGGMDFLVLRAFFEAVQKRTQTPIDVYDTAAWMAITPLSEESIAMGSMPVPIPDFTNGKWIDPRPYVKGTYCLEEVCRPGALE